MKRKFFLSILVAVAATLSSQAQDPQAISINAGNVEQLTVTDNMEIVLVQGNTVETAIKIDKDAADKVGVRVANKSMELSLQRPLAKNQRQVVLVYVNDLKQLTVSGNAIVKTSGALKIANLDLYVDGNAYAYLATTGKINAFPYGEGQIKVKHLSAPSNKKGY